MTLHRKVVNLGSFFSFVSRGSYMRVCTYIHIHVCVFIHTCTRTCAYICVCVHVCVCVYMPLCSLFLCHLNLKRIPLLTGKQRVAVFGSAEGESSDDSLVDLASTESWSIAELPKHCFYHELVFQRNAVFGGESHVTFYERLASSQTASFCKELIFELLKRRKIEVLGK